MTVEHTVVGLAGRRTTSRMIDAIVDAAPQDVSGRVAVLLSAGDERASQGDNARSWSEVLSSVTPEDVVVAPAHDPRLLRAAGLTGARVVTFGLDDTAHVWADELRAGSAGTELVVHLGTDTQELRLALLGEHFVDDALAAVAAASALGIDLATAVQALTRMRPHQSAMHPTFAPTGSLLIDDSASMVPDSVVAALKTLAIIGTEGRRTVAVLGELDLSPGLTDEAVREAHDRIGRIIVRLGIHLVVVIGDSARHIHNAAGLEGSWNGESVLVADTEAAYDRVSEDLGAGDAVLVKFGDSTAAQKLIRRLEKEDVA